MKKNLIIVVLATIIILLGILLLILLHRNQKKYSTETSSKSNYRTEIISKSYLARKGPYKSFEQFFKEIYNKDTKYESYYICHEIDELKFYVVYTALNSKNYYTPDIDLYCFYKNEVKIIYQPKYYVGTIVKRENDNLIFCDIDDEKAYIIFENKFLTSKAFIHSF
ncbi:hypothetical protein AAEX28_15515 [Lentisphaerota bacterium WC36G]|nr:hypothetical protein LJT99_02270 [Lentisphaerae bacterium WC36]